MLINQTTRRFLLTMCAAATLMSTGCRSMPGMKMFAGRSEPSAEALAGTGPSKTYPAPPSTTATPEAIASVAGGTAPPAMGKKPGAVTAQVAGYNITPGYATPASTTSSTSNDSTTNMAAAQANGVYGGYAPPSLTQAKPSGYTFGNSNFTPKASPETVVSAASTAPSAAEPSYVPPSSSYSLPGRTAATSALPTPSTGYTSPPPTSPAPSSLASSLSSTPTTGGGFALPSGVAPAAAALAPAAAKESGPISFSLPDNASPSFSTASTNSPMSANSTSTGYTPGSTGKATGYPTGGESPTTSGSFYR